MESWKRKQGKKAGFTKKGSSLWKARLASVVFLGITVAGTFYAFPHLWNQTMDFVQAKTGKSLPRTSEQPFRLGLDLQGGTQLLYDADMKQIPEAEREAALSGVKDVIEKRVNSFGVAEPLVQTTTTGGNYRVIVELAGILDVDKAIAQIGETPVLEFKELNQDNTPDREATDAEKAELEKRQKEEKVAADAILARAKKGENFEALVTEASIDPNKAEKKGVIDGLTDAGPLGSVVKTIKDSKLKVNQLIPNVVETPDGLSIIKYTGTKEDEEMNLSHILVCFEGKTGCQNPISALDANIAIDNLKKEATKDNFADLAEKNSTDPSAKQNKGDLGWVTPGMTVPAFELAARALKPGEISGVVETDFGYHIIYKKDTRKVNTYSIQRIVMKQTKLSDIIPPSSPWKNTPLSGKHLSKAQVQFDQQNNAPNVGLQFNDEGGKLFGDLTARLVGQPIGIFLDGNEISSPRVNQAIYGGQAVITGNFSLDEAKQLAQRLNAGALPVPISLLSQQTVGPTLGIASLNKSVYAALVGFGLIALFMITMYRVPGFLSIVALVFYAVCNLVAYRYFEVTMSLSGIAGLVLSLGIAVDANVLIFERMKDEYRSGRDLFMAIDEGFKRAWLPIRDGHLTTLISAFVLYTFSSSFVRGFALTLGIGVVLSLFTAITVTRLYMVSLRAHKLFQKASLYSLKRNA